MAINQPPAVVIVARHGARLDAADKQWHLTSPTPYDPPLTYGGWMQSRALGTKIANLLQAREEEHNQLKNSNGQGDGGHRRRKRHRVIIHSSPFVRCIQTSIAISAGLAQQQKVSEQPHGRPNVLRTTPQGRSKERAGSLSVIPEPPEDEDSPNLQISSASPSRLKAAKLRIDAFLGEWLSPDYFENITPPPSSVMMVAGCKAELLRPGEKIEGSDLTDKGSGHFPGGWKNAFGDPSTIEEEEHGNGLANISSIANALPRSRSSTQSSDGRPPARLSRISTNMDDIGKAYVPPTPTYAISASDKIPSGYVAHARDACVDIDYRWDSMREPQDWGDGGQYGEEWSAMHKRFRNGFYKLLDWYREVPLEDVETDVDVDTVVILVTHGAGCNALLGALTNQPVLLDVGMASLTMATRKDQFEHPIATQSPPSSPRHTRNSSINVTEEYEVKLTASTDHLRGGQNAMSPSSATRSASGQWRRIGSISTSGLDSEDNRPSTSHGLYRSSTMGLRSQVPIPAVRQFEGLWGTNAEAASDTGEIDSIPNFANANANPVETFTADAVKKSEMSNGIEAIQTPHMPSRTSSQSQKGLWSSGSFARESPAKRRWTVNEQNK